MNLLLGRIRKESGTGLLRFSDRAGMGARQRYGISVGEEEPVAACDSRAPRRGVILPGPVRKGGPAPTTPLTETTEQSHA
jgi:hypothetical protein